MRSLLIPSLLGLLAGVTLATAEETPLTIPISQPVTARAVNQPPPAAGKGGAGILVHYLLGGGEHETFLPVVADTFIGGETVWGGKDFIALRKDSQKHDALMRVETSYLPPGAVVRAAEFQFCFNRPRTLQFNKTIGSFKLTFHAIDIPWSEDATALKPSAAGDATWTPPRVGAGIARESFAEFAGNDQAVVDKQVTTVPGFGPLVADWASGKRPNQGFAAVLSGPVNGVALQAREGLKNVAQPPLLGGPGQAGVALPVPIVILRALSPTGTDLRTLKLTLNLRRAGKAPTAGQGTLRLYALKPEAQGKTVLAAAAWSGEPLAQKPLADIGGGRSTAVDVELPVAAVRPWLTDASAAPELFVTVEDAAGAAPAFDMVLPTVKTVVFTAALAPAEVRLECPRGLQSRSGVYVENRGGHLFYGGERLRLWGMISPQRPNLEMLARARATGFNAIRLWGPRLRIYSEPGAAVDTSTPGGADIDEYDRFFAAAKKQGMFVMDTSLIGPAPVDAKSDWLRSVGNPADWEDWKKAITPMPEGWVFPFFAAFDERVFAARQANIRNYLTHRNPYTGKTYAEDEAIVIYELSNEGAHVKRVMERGLDKWPEYFRRQLTRRWNDWLTQRYHNDSGLRQAWGKLNDGESLTNGRVAAAPVMSQRKNYPDPRCEDFLRFLTELEISMCQRLEAYARTFAPAGVGVNVVPFSYDTQYQPNTPWSYGSAQGQVANFGMYFWHMTSALTVPPSMYVMDSYTVQDRVTVIYETMAARPNPVRAEYAFKMAAFASWQNWDAIFFHYYMGLLDEKRTFAPEDYLVRAMTYIAPDHFWTGTYYDQDPVLISSMALAGRIFLSGAIAPAPRPVTFVLGGKGIFNLDRYGWMAPGQAAFSRGARLRYEPKGDFDLRVEGAAEDDFMDAPAGAIEAGDIVWDWPNGRLLIDTPVSKAYVGRPAGAYRFNDGIAVGGFDGEFVAFGMHSLDGKPLTESARVLISATRDARNYGAVMDLKSLPPDGKFMPPLEMGRRVLMPGTAPVVIDRVPFSLWFPTEREARLESYDFACRRQDVRKLSGGQITHDGKPQFITLLTVDKFGAACATPATERAIAKSSAAASSATGEALPPPADPALWTPLPGLAWNDAPQTALRRFRQLARKNHWRLGFIRDAADACAVEGTNAFFNASGRLEFAGSATGLQRIEMVFSNPPPLARVVEQYTQELGAPASRELSPTADKPSTIRWQLAAPRGPTQVELVEVQGVMTLRFERK